ncbi:MAG: hypothetical protein J5501_11080 [Ruminococcus sp.]|nr:hypothetical protein [Ruminococcus sp.]
MEFLFAILIIIVILKILGVSNGAIAVGGLGIIELIIISSFILFIVATISMLFCKRRTASFVRIDKDEKQRFKTAYYSIDGVEYPCIFPSEVILNDKMYRTDRTYNVLFNERRGKVYDIWCVLTCIVGLLSFGAAAAASGGMIYMMLTY